jgi:hypothetical protein
MVRDDADYQSTACYLYLIHTESVCPRPPHRIRLGRLGTFAPATAVDNRSALTLRGVSCLEARKVPLHFLRIALRFATDTLFSPHSPAGGCFSIALPPSAVIPSCSPHYYFVTRWSILFLVIGDAAHNLSSRINYTLLGLHFFLCLLPGTPYYRGCALLAFTYTGTLAGGSSARPLAVLLELSGRSLQKHASGMYARES